MNTNDNTDANETAADTATQDPGAEQPKRERSEGRQKLQTELFEIEPAAVEQIKALSRQLYDLCIEHNVPAVMAFAFASDENSVTFAGGQAFETSERVPLKFAAAGQILFNDAICHDDAQNEILDFLEDLIERETNSNPLAAILRAFANRD